MNVEVDGDSRAQAALHDKQAAMPDAAKKRQIQKADPETVAVQAKVHWDSACTQMSLIIEGPLGTGKRGAMSLHLLPWHHKWGCHQGLFLTDNCLLVPNCFTQGMC